MADKNDADTEFPPPIKIDNNAFKRVTESGQPKTLLGRGSGSEDEKQ